MIDDSPVGLIRSITYLGVQVHKCLVWEEQIISVQAKVSHLLGFLKHATNFYQIIFFANYFEVLQSHILNTAVLCGGTVLSSE